MKKAKYLFFTIIISLTTLSVLGENNFGVGFGFSFEDAEPKITQKQVRDEVKVQLIDPLTKCYVAAHPEIMMMKCMAYMKFEFSGHSARFLEEDTKFNSTYGIQGEVIFDDCGNETHVASVMLNFSKDDKVMVQESFFSEFVTAEAFVKDFCEKMESEKTSE
ncbi:MAG: hypothetical protein GQ574_01750 [Crocinitomix sp.]|nr:hypothetical protein [Crocinitomix sp.]